jgi:hypothetical protein
MAKLRKFLALTLLTTIMVIAALGITSAQAQGTAIILPSIGGTTTPEQGTYNYADGSTQTFTAEAEPPFLFTEWVITAGGQSSSSTENPISLPMIAGVTYEIQAHFTPVNPVPGSTTLPSDMANAAIVVIFAASGGTTNPPSGTYALADAEALLLSATPQSGFEFSHWVISGDSTDHGGAPLNLQPTDNPYNVHHGYGYKYNYQPVFFPTGETVPTPTNGASPTPTDGGIAGLSMEWIIIVALVVIIVIMLVAFGAILSKRRH